MSTPKTALTALAIAAAAFIFPSAVKAQVTIAENDNLQIYMTVDTVGTLQILNDTDAYAPTTTAFYSTSAANLAKGKQFSPITPGFQTAFGNMGFGGKFGKNHEIEMYYELYLDTWNHQSTTYGHEGYLTIHGIPGEAEGVQFLNGVFKYVDLKVGQYELQFGDAYLHRSFNANVKNNLLIGNFVMDPNMTPVAAEVRSKEDSKLIFLLGINGGVTSDSFAAGHGTGYQAKLGYKPIEGLRVSGSYFAVDHSKSPVIGGASATMWNGNRSGARYEGVLGNSPGVTPNILKKVSAYQFDAGYEGKCHWGNAYSVYGNYGKVKEDDQGAANSWIYSAATPIKPPYYTEQWSYYALQGSYNLTKNLYLAARYSTARANTLSKAPTPSTAANQTLNVASDGHVDRISAGFGYQMGKHVRVKAELVQQKYHDFAAGQNYNGLQAWRDPGFHGGLMEFAFWF